jgi:hypothetical protein
MWKQGCNYIKRKETIIWLLPEELIFPLDYGGHKRDVWINFILLIIADHPDNNWFTYKLKKFELCFL